MQPKLPLSAGLLYECANPDCFYCGSLLDLEDVVWKDYWDSSIEDLSVRATCPSCSDPMMIWSDDDGTFV